MTIARFWAVTDTEIKITPPRTGGGGGGNPGTPGGRGNGRGPTKGGWGKGGGGVWTPADLFAGGENGVWYEAADVSTLYQTDDTSTPVTADGQTIGRWADKSGNNNTLIQATAGARPLYKTDGSLHWALFDGSDDGMGTGALTSKILTATGGAFAIAYEATDPEKVGHLIAEQRSAANFFRTSLMADTRASPNRFALTNNTGFGGDAYVNYPSEQAADVRTAILNNEAGTLKGYHNGSVLASTTPVQVQATTTEIDVGFNQATTLNHTGKIFAMVALDRTLTAEEITNLTTYLMEKAGI